MVRVDYSSLSDLNPVQAGSNTAMTRYPSITLDLTVYRQMQRMTLKLYAFEKLLPVV